MLRKVKLVDTTTGELLDVPLHVPPSRKPTIYGSRWFQMSQDAATLLAKDKELRGQTHAVLLYLYGKLDFDNYLTISQQEIADTLDMYQPDVSKSLSKLVKKEILLKESTNRYRLNPDYGWKGDNKKAHEYQLELIKGGKS